MSAPTLAAVMVAPHQPIQFREFERPQLPPGSALLRTARSEVCGTDVHLWHGRLSGVPYPISTINAHQHINREHLEIRGCWGSEARHFLRALRLLDRHAHAVPWRAIGAKTYPLTALNEALVDAETMILTKAIVDPWGHTNGTVTRDTQL